MRRIVKIILGVPLALIVLGAGAAFSLPSTRHAISGYWNLPDRLPALPDAVEVHYQPGAEVFAHDVAALYPDAIARVEAVHGRPFTHPVVVGAYATMDAYTAANGLGSDIPVGVTFAGRVNLSPKLFRPQHRRLQAILTHELSHAHLQGWIGYRYVYLPNWFKEGLAVMISGGGGAELVSEDDARSAIARGERLVVNDSVGALPTSIDVGLEKTPANKPTWYPTVLAYREAGMFVGYLRESDRPAFDRMMNAVLDGRSFADAVSEGYHSDARTLWDAFVKSGSGQN